MVRAHRAQYFFAYTLEEIYPCTEIGAGNVVIHAKTVTGNQLWGALLFSNARQLNFMVFNPGCSTFLWQGTWFMVDTYHSFVGA